MMLKQMFRYFAIFITPFIFIDSTQSEHISCSQDGLVWQLAGGYFQCITGWIVPVACAASDGSRVEIGGTYVQQNYFVFECRHSASTISLFPIACQQQGRVIQPGETYALQSMWFTCAQTAHGINLQASGCVTPTGERVSANSTFKTNDFLFACLAMPDGAIYTQPQACIVDGQEYQPGSEMDSSSKSCWYRCQRTADNGLQLQVMGCLEGGKKYNIDDSMITGDYIFRCVRNSDQSVSRQPIGCVQNPITDKIEHKFGDRWIEGDTNVIKYVFECKGGPNSVSKVAVQCLYDGPEGYGQVDGGCARRFGTAVLQCYQEANMVMGQLTMNAPADFEQNIIGTGLRLC